jgi:hypothetical protein
MDPETLTAEAQAILAALIGAKLAWQSPRELRLAAALDEDSAEDALLDLDLAGWLATWEVDDVMELTLTPIAAVALGVHLAEFGDAELPRWIRNGTNDPLPPRKRHPLTRYTALAILPDPVARPEPEHTPTTPEPELSGQICDPLLLEWWRKKEELKERDRLRKAFLCAGSGKEKRKLKRAILHGQRRAS